MAVGLEATVELTLRAPKRSRVPPGLAPSLRGCGVRRGSGAVADGGRRQRRVCTTAALKKSKLLANL